MENDNNKKDITYWVALTRDISGAKLEWLKQQLETKKIPYKMDEIGLRGVVFEVRVDELSEAWMILETPIGEFYTGMAAPVYNDLDNNHPFFAEFVPVITAPTPAEAWMDVEFSDEPQGQVRMLDIDSSTLSALGFKHYSLKDEIESVRLYVRFKGGTYYRYFPLDITIEVKLYDEIKRKKAGDREASVGSMFHHLVKVPADAGEITCEKLDESGTWTEIAPKAERTKTIKKLAKEISSKSVIEPMVVDELPAETKTVKAVVEEKKAEAYTDINNEEFPDF